MTYEEECLKAYLESWLAWVEVGAPVSEPYYRSTGLCNNVQHFVGAGNFSRCIKLQAALDECFDGEDYPFGEYAYEDAMYNDTMHEDQNRIQWVKDKIKELSDKELSDANL